MYTDFIHLFGKHEIPLFEDSGPYGKTKTILKLKSCSLVEGFQKFDTCSNHFLNHYFPFYFC